MPTLGTPAFGTPAFGSYQPAASHPDAGMQIDSFYLTMRDGVRLAADLHRPANLDPAEKLPTVVYITRYWRSIEFRPGFRWIGTSSLAPWRFFTSHGYALLTVDARGTGASFGTRAHEWDAEEVKDGGEIAAWISAQPWSNGMIGAVGTSYSGTTAELMAVHPAVKAVLPRFNEYDVYTDIAFPGGLYLRGFVDQWSQSTTELDANHMRESASTPFLERVLMGLGAVGIKPVNDDRAALRQAVAEHTANVHAAELARDTVYRDDVAAINGSRMSDYSVYAYREAIERSGAALYGWGGWFDAVTADAVIRRWLTVQAPQIAVIGPWNHGGSQHASPYAPARSNTQQHWEEFLRFFDYELKGVQTGIDADIAAKTLTYFTIGEEVWKTTTSWPPGDIAPRKLYFAPDSGLTEAVPSAGVDDYTIDFEATTGSSNRWFTQSGGGAVLYPNRAEADSRLLTYTSERLARDLEITGYPVVTLYLTSSADDGAFFVYLEAVEPDGKVTYLTEGMLRALHRKISTDAPPYAQPVPYHSFERKDGAPLVPGEVAELTFGLLPISVLLRAGQRIRVAISGADASVFPRLPETGTPEISVRRGGDFASHITLPVLDR